MATLLAEKGRSDGPWFAWPDDGLMLEARQLPLLGTAAARAFPHAEPVALREFLTAAENLSARGRFG